jgi:phosphoribosylformylglycinamidine synthase subunit PurS
MKIGVRILPRPEVLDTQGRAVAQTLKEHGRSVEGLRVGKYIEVNVDQTDQTAALNEVKKIAEFVLVNPLIETFELDVVNEAE